MSIPARRTRKKYRRRGAGFQAHGKISEDISRKDVKQLWSHFRSLASKYQSNTQFSAMYVKFVFSNVIRELFQENRFAGEHRLDLEVDHLYGCSTIQEIIEVTEKISASTRSS